MKFLSITVILIFIALSFSTCKSQTNPTFEASPTETFRQLTDKKVSGNFEFQDYMYLDMPDQITAIDTSPGWAQEGERILLTGKILTKDGKEPVPDVILYYYHTDVDGYYSKNELLDSRAVRHGYIRGWVKSDREGRYSIYTVMPGAYPGLGEPAHIHPSVKEPGYQEYWIDEFVFANDPLLKDDYTSRVSNRGGSGIVSLEKKGDLLVGQRNIYLGLNVPGY